MLARDQPQPRRYLSARLKIMTIPKRRDEGCRTQRPNPLHLLQALARFQLVAEACELARDLNNPGIKRVQLSSAGSAGGRAARRITHCPPLLSRGAGACGSGQ